MLKDDHLKKVLTWRFISIILTIVCVYLMTGDIKESTRFTVILHVLLTCFHYVFEKLWDKQVQKKSAR